MLNEDRTEDQYYLENFKEQLMCTDGVWRDFHPYESIAFWKDYEWALSQAEKTGCQCEVKLCIVQ